MFRRIQMINAANEIKRHVQSNSALYLACGGGLAAGLILARRSNRVTLNSVSYIYPTTTV